MAEYESPPKVDRPDDPNRCQAAVPNGQCINLAIEHEGVFGNYCIAHGGNKFVEGQKRKGIRNYNLTKFKAQLIQKSENPAIKTLNEEIGILRLMLETALNRCSDDSELLLSSAKISNLIMNINTLVISFQKLQKNLGQHLDKSAILQFASEVIDVIAKELEDNPEAVNNIADGIMKIVGRIGDESE